MNYPLRRILRPLPATGLGLLLLHAPLVAQTADDELAFELSPFEVSATEDVGYRATDTLAGIRVRTDLRDVASAITVVTSQFLQNTGATDSASLLQYTVGTEVGGLQGNFSGIVSGTGDVNDSGSRQTPQNNNRVRGLVSADNTRNFYLTDIPWDGYNTTRIDILRGPNSILFGNGSGAGIINGDTEGATLGTTGGRVEFRYGQFGSYRGMLNYNQEVLANELAVRVAAVFDKDFYRQEPAFQETERYYAAARWEPAFLKRDRMRTIIKANYETGETEANRPRTGTMVDHVTPWFRTTPEQMVAPDGTVLGTLQPLRTRAGYDPFIVTTWDANLAAAHPDRLDIGAGSSNALSSNREPWLRPDSVDDFGGLLTGGFWAIFPDADGTNPSAYIAQNTSVSDGFKVRNSLDADGNLVNIRGTPQNYRNPQNRFINSLAGYAVQQDFLYQNQGLYRDTMISDPEVFDFYNYLLDGPNKREWSEFEAFNASLEQSFLNDQVSFQASYDWQEYSDGRTEYIGGIPRLFIDTNIHLPVALPDGNGNLIPQVNPNFGRPFIIASGGGSNQRWVNRETYRFTPIAEIDFAKITRSDNTLIRLLGQFNITGLLEKSKIHRESRGWQNYALSLDSVAAIGGRLDDGIAAGGRSLRTVNYLGGSTVGMTSPSQMNLSSISGQRDIGTGTARYFNSTFLPGIAPSGPLVGGTALGLLPNQNQVATFSRRASEDPLNYVGWTTPGQVTYLNAQGGDRDQLYRNWDESRDVTSTYALVGQWKLLQDNLTVIAGVRRDTVDGYRGPDGAGSRPRFNPLGAENNNGAVNPNQPWELSKDSEFKSELLETYNVTLRAPEFITRHLPWGIVPRIFYATSENFQPASRLSWRGNALAPPTADTEEYGFSIEALDGRFALRVNRFETNTLATTYNDPIDFNLPGRAADEISRSSEFALRILTNDRSISDTLTVPEPLDPGPLTNQPGGGYRFRDTSEGTNTTIYNYEPAQGNLATWTTADFEAANALAEQQARALLASLDNDDARQVMAAWGIEDPNTYYQSFLAGSFENDYTRGLYPAGWSGLNGFAMTQDTQSKGTEIEMFMRPTDNWDILVNVAKIEAIRRNIAGEVGAWVADRWEIYQTAPGDDVNRGPGGMRWFSGGQGASVSDTGHARFGRNAFWRYSIALAQEGNNTPENRIWRFNVISNYRFTEGRLDGFFVGGAYRWQDKNIIGYEPIEIGTETLAGGATRPIGTVNLDKPYKGPTQDAVDVWLGYKAPIYDGKVDWTIQVNVRNAFDSKKLIPVTTNPDGSVAAFTVAEGMTWELTTRFEF